MPKSFYQSKTLWVNVAAIIIIICNSVWGIEFEAEAEAAMATTFLAIVNIILRFITKQPIK